MNRTLFHFGILFFCIYSFALSSDKESLIQHDKSANTKIDKLKRFESINNDFDTPVYFDNNITLDNNIDLLDYYVYEFTENSYTIIARLKNKSDKYLEWVKLRYNFYDNEQLKGTDFTYIDYESYGSSGISPYKESFIQSYVDKVDFDNISYEIEYDVEYGQNYILWDQILEIKSVLIKPFGNYFQWQGEVNNNTDYSMEFPCIYACIFNDNKMVAFDYTFLDVNDNTIEPNSIGVFDSFIDLPEIYDDIKYYLGYSLYTLQGEGNLKPNIPIFSNNQYEGLSRSCLRIKIFIIDPNDDRIGLTANVNNIQTVWTEGLHSGIVANIQYCFSEPGQSVIQVKAIDQHGLESVFSDSVVINISESTEPQIISSICDTAYYQNYYTFQPQVEGGLTPYSWNLEYGQIPNGLILNTSNGQISGLPNCMGSFEFILRVSDSGTPSFSDTSGYEIFIVNNPPQIISPDTLLGYTNSQVTYIPSAIDPEENELEFDFINQPEWLEIIDTSLQGIAPDIPLDTSFQVIASDGILSDTLTVRINTLEQTSIQSDESIPESYELFQNYPNPFNQNTKIKIALIDNIEVELVIIDINGKVINTIYKGVLDKGIRKFNWNASSIPSGIYFIKLKSAKFNNVIKCMILK